MKPIIYIDESGTLPDPNDKIIVIAAVGILDMQNLNSLLKSTKKKQKHPEKASELKFYRAGDKTKNLFLKRLTEQQVSIFVLIVEKLGRKINDSPLNFATLCGILLSDVLNFYPDIQKIVFDKHFHKINDQNKFDAVLQKFIKQNLPLEHVDSQIENQVNVADMVAGAVLYKETGKRTIFYTLIKEKIINEIKLNWPEAKRKLFGK